MSLEWQQLVTHLVGFVITVLILKKYAWGPLMAMMDERRNKIADEFRQIEDGKADVAQLTADYQAKMKEIDNERRAKLVEAVEEGKKLSAELKQNAQQEVKTFQDKAKADLEREVDKAKVELRDQMVAMTMTATEKIIHERLDDNKHRQLINQFIDGLEKA